jgi:hypothetical protein
MKIDGTDFGSITIDGRMYPHDVLIRMSGKIQKRKKKLSKKVFGTSHILSLDEAQFVYEKGSHLLVLGTGQDENLRLSPEAVDFFEHRGCHVLAESTPRAVAAYNAAKDKKKIGLFHVTC